MKFPEQLVEVLNNGKVTSISGNGNTLYNPYFPREIVIDDANGDLKYTLTRSDGVTWAVHVWPKGKKGKLAHYSTNSRYLQHFHILARSLGP
jgi:hypothetical protein